MELNINESKQIVNEKSFTSEKKITSKSFYSKQNKIPFLTRRYTCFPGMNQKNFAPKLHPRENTLNIKPTKLSLISTKEILPKKNFSPSSCPVSEDENKSNRDSDTSKNLSDSNFDDDDNSSSDYNDNEKFIKINDIRKNFIHLKKDSIYRNKSKKDIRKDNCINKILNIEKDNNINNNHNQYEEYGSNLFSIKEKNEILECKKHKQSCNIILSFGNRIEKMEEKQRNRINSFSILETLENKTKNEK